MCIQEVAGELALDWLITSLLEQLTSFSLETASESNLWYNQITLHYRTLFELSLPCKPGLIL